MAITPKLMFYGVLGTNEADVTTGPAENKRWIISKILATSVDTSYCWLTLKHYINASYTRTLVSKYVMNPDNTLGSHVFEYGPVVMENGHKIRGLAQTADKIEVVAYGYEEDA